MASAGRSLCFHVYRTGGLWGEDKIVKGEDRVTHRYYLKVTRNLARWQSTLHAEGPNGILVCDVKSPYVGPPMAPTDRGPTIISMASERRPIHISRGPGGTCSFRGLDDEEYRWHHICNPLLASQCLDQHNQVVASYRVTLMAISKDGELCVHPSGQFMVDLLVATCLAVRTPEH
ncbi:hypothetical protein BU15DRAFT_53384 [Melanogaster broomeanus]|nr:hypothetical protein BU15DRAFT_53384 [Melanogaster broomeanus]